MRDAPETQEVPAHHGVGRQGDPTTVTRTLSSGPVLPWNQEGTSLRVGAPHTGSQQPGAAETRPRFGAKAEGCFAREHWTFRMALRLLRTESRGPAGFLRTSGPDLPWFSTIRDSPTQGQAVLGAELAGSER